MHQVQFMFKLTEDTKSESPLKRPEKWQVCNVVDETCFSSPEDRKWLFFLRALSPSHEGVISPAIHLLSEFPVV